MKHHLVTTIAALIAALAAADFAGATQAEITTPQAKDETTAAESKSDNPPAVGKRRTITGLQGRKLELTPETFVVRPAIYDAKVVASFPHDSAAFTQGLFFANGALFETTGQYGESQIRQLNLRKGSVSKKTDLPEGVFGEGATVIGDQLISLTWRSGIGYVHNVDDLSLVKNFDYEGEGWGLTYDGERLILSDGTDQLRFFDPETFEETGAISITFAGQPVRYLNELEWIDGEVWANVWQQDVILRIDPETGVVMAVVDLTQVYPVGEREKPKENVLNGIAYEPNSKRLFVTGKRWPKLYEIDVSLRGDQPTPNAQ